MKVVNRLPKVGDILVDSSCYLYLVLGFSDLKICISIKLGGCLYAFENYELLNSDATIQYINNTIEAILTNKIAFEYLAIKKNVITYTKLNENVVEGHLSVKGNCSDYIYGVLDNYNYNNSDIKVWYMKHKLVNSKLPELIDIDSAISNEILVRTRKKKEDYEKKKNGLYLKVKDLQECCFYKSVSVKNNTEYFFLYLGEFNGEKAFIKFNSYSFGANSNNNYLINGYGTLKYYKSVPKLYSEPIYTNITKNDLGPKVIKSLEYASKKILDKLGITRGDIDAIRFGRYT